MFRKIVSGIMFTLILTSMLIMAPITSSQPIPMLDQYVPGIANLWRSIATFSPMGQTFRPSLNTLAYVEVNIGGDVLNDPSGAVYTIALNIREATIIGSIIANSTRTFTAPFYDGWQTFDFPDVYVTAEDIYVIELVILFATGNPEWPAITLGTYDRGQTILSGGLTGNSDNFFRSYGYQMTPISSTLDIHPDTLNLRSKGQWITAYIELPEGYNVRDINISSILLNDTIPVDPSAPTAIGDYDNDSIPDLMVKFNRTEVIDYILDNIDIEERFTTVILTITGYLYDGTPFQGSDTIIVIIAPRAWEF